MGKLFSVCLFYFACNQEQTRDAMVEKDITKIALGSCNKISQDQSMWDNIALQSPDLFVWLGDIVYGDTDDMQVLKEKYDLLKTNPEYAAFIENTPVIGIWDDHDYGLNDGGKEYSLKDESQQILLDFLDVPADAPQRNRKGAYSSYTLGDSGREIKVILLDARYFRDSLHRSSVTEINYIPNETGDILGEEQWHWLEQELTNSNAKIHIIGSGIQIIPEQHRFEKWANFPTARTRLLELLSHTKASFPILVSGDRHIAEISKLDIPGLEFPLYELTTSGITHTWSEPWPEENKHRIGEYIRAKNYGLIKVEWTGETPHVEFEIRGLNDTLYKAQKLLP